MEFVDPVRRVGDEELADRRHTVIYSTVRPLDSAGPNS
jgi:hypothetical protein